VLERRGAGTVVRTHQGPLEHSCRPAVDVTLRSALEVWGGNCLVLVMTGMGQDGAAGAQGLHAAGARIFVQDEASSVVWGMPGAVVKLGLADRVLPLERLADELMGVVALANGTGQQRSA
jgi:two-component system chemotaxis response regulator CheB